MGSGINTEHILLALATTQSTIAYELLNDHLINIDQIRLILSLRGRETQLQAGISPYAKKILELASQYAYDYQHVKIDAEHLLLGIVSYPDCLAFQIIMRIGIDPKKIKSQIINIFEELNKLDAESLEMEDEFIYDDLPKLPHHGFGFPGFGIPTPNFPKNSQKKSKYPTIEYFGTNLTDLAKQNKLDPVVGRETELQRLTQILARRTKNNPVLVGDPGVGKTAIVEGLANRIVQSSVPSILKDKQIFQLDMALMVAGTTYRGQFEERIKKVIAEVKKNKNIILFVDELHTIIGAGSAEGSMDAANILKPALAKGEIRMIGATTTEEFRRAIEKDSALERRLQKITVFESTIDETIAILNGLKKTYERFHDVEITNEAINAAAVYAQRFIADRFLPDKAIDLIDEAASALQILKVPQVELGSDWKNKIDNLIKQKEKAFKEHNFEKAAKLRILELEMLKNKPKKIVRSEKKSRVTADKIAQIVTAWTGIPVGTILKEEQQRLRNIEKNIKKYIVGQDEAVKAIASAIRRSKVGISNPNRPLASFMFLGPTGVGKTYLTQTLARIVYGSESSLIRIDMSEFMEKHNLSRLIGAPPGYVGYEQAGKLTEAIRKKPFSVVLFDELEKAHPDIFNILLQILEDGKLTDASGREVSFKHSIVIMTSNIGSETLTKQASIGFQNYNNPKFSRSYNSIKDDILKELYDRLKPELLNRLDKTIVFKPLDQKAIIKIVSNVIVELYDRLKAEGYLINISEQAKKYLALKGFDPNFGVRPLKRAIIDYLEDPLADLLLSGKLAKNSQINVTLQNGILHFEYTNIKPNTNKLKNASRASATK